MGTKNILITGADDFTAPYLYDAMMAAFGPETKTWMLGTGENAGMKADLAYGTVDMPAAMDLVIHCDSLDGGMPGEKADVDSFTQRAINLTRSLQDSLPGAVVYISSAAVYGLEEGDLINETTSCAPVNPLGKAKLAVEDILAGWCRGNNVPLAILRPAMTVGTGMGGELRQIVNRVWRGTYRHIKENTARRSVVHAESLARAVVAVAGREGVWNVTDGCDPLLHDLVEALSVRLDHKRVYSIDLAKGRLLAKIGDWIPVTGFTTATLQHQLASLTFDGSKLVRETGFEATPVVSYLQTHNYDDSSR